MKYVQNVMGPKRSRDLSAQKVINCCVDMNQKNQKSVAGLEDEDCFLRHQTMI